MPPLDLDALRQKYQAYIKKPWHVPTIAAWQNARDFAAPQLLDELAEARRTLQTIRAWTQAPMREAQDADTTARQFGVSADTVRMVAVACDAAIVQAKEYVVMLLAGPPAPPED